MSKKIIGFLLVVCMVIALVPVMASAAGSAKIRLLSYCDLTVTEGGAAAYSVNVETDMTDANGDTFKGWLQTQEGANANNWNVKFEWPTGGIPTVTLKGAKFDQYNDEKKAYGTGDNAAIMPLSGCSSLEIVIAEDSMVDANCGAFDTNGKTTKNLTITSVGEAKLTVKGSFKLFYVAHASQVTVNANLNLENRTPCDQWYGDMMAPFALNNGNLVINGGNIKLKSGQQCIYTKGTGNIEINGGNVEMISDGGMYEGAVYIHTAGDITINGGTVKVIHSGRVYGGPALQTKLGNFVVTGGDIFLEGSMRAVSIPEYSEEKPELEQYEIKISGGTVVATSTAESRVYGAFFEAPVLTGYFDAKAGDDEESAEWYDVEEGMFECKWVKFVKSDTPVTRPTTEPTEPPTTAPTQAPAATKAPTKATAPTKAPTKATAPTKAPTVAGDNSANTVLWIVLALVVVVGIVAVVVILVAGKKKPNKTKKIKKDTAE